MLAADKLLLQSNLKQRTIQLREKELNLFNNNFAAVGTQAAVLAGFTITCLIEITIPQNPNYVVKSMLHLYAVLSICANLMCVTLATMVSVWGSGMALRGKDGSMGAAVDGMIEERNAIFGAFGFGLVANLLSVLSAAWLLMSPEIAVVATVVISTTIFKIVGHARRLFAKFQLQDKDIVRFDDLLDITRGSSLSLEEQQLLAGAMGARPGTPTARRRADDHV
eukprot:g7504.t1